MSTATGIPAAAETGPPRTRGLAAVAVILLAVLAGSRPWAAIWPLVRGNLTSVPDQRLVDLNVYRTGGLSVMQGQPLYTVLTPPPQLLRSRTRRRPRCSPCRWRCWPGRPPSWPGFPSSTSARG